MSHLAQADGERLLSFVAEAQTLDGPEPFNRELLDALAEVMDSQFATYYEFDRLQRTQYGFVNCSLEARYASPVPTEGRRLPEQADVDVAADQVRLWSDTIDRASRWRFESLTFAKAFEIVDCAWTVFDLYGSQRAMLALHRQGRDFFEQDRVRVGTLRPHVSALIRHAHARRRLADLMSAVDSTDENESRGFVLLGGNLQIEHASRAARRLLGRWFGGFDGRLPPVIDDWARSELRGEPLRIDKDGKRLVVETSTRGALHLTEAAMPPRSLTARELEVLRGLAAGKSTGQIASDLWVTPSTVSKHLEHVYRKLGVTSRTAALAAVGVESLDSKP